jgi:hypothetical protein
LGTMTFGEDWGWGASKKECTKMGFPRMFFRGPFVKTLL